MAGSIRERSPGVWQVRVSVGRHPVTGKYRYVSKTVRGTKTDAKRVAAGLVADGEAALGPEVWGTLGQLLDQWMAHIEAQGRSPYTLWRYRTAIHAHLRPALGHIDVTKLRASDIDAFYAGLIAEGLNPLTVRKYHAILSASLRQGVKWGWIDRSPIERASPPSVRHREIVPPSVEEVAKLLHACEERHADLAAMIYVAATTGCRRGELCALLWGDIDLDDATVVVARSVADSPAGVEVKDTKTHQTRKISLDPSTVEVLRLHRERCESVTASVDAAVTDKSFVWSQSPDFSEPYRPTRVSATFRDLRDATGLTHVSFHALRHFAATVLAGKGVAVRTIAGRLGHANPSVTLKTYAHFLEAADREAAEAISDVAERLTLELRNGEGVNDQQGIT